MPSGTWAEWITGLATFVAVAVAVWAFLDERRKGREGAESRRDEIARSRASHALAYVAPDYVEVADPARPDKRKRILTGLSLVIHNGSPEPLIRWHAEVFDRQNDAVLTERCWLDDGLVPPMHGGEELRLSLSEELADRAASMLTVLRFEDGLGQHWRREAGLMEQLPTAPDYRCMRSSCAGEGR